MSVFRKISRFFIRLVAILLLLVLSLWLLIQTDPVQNWLLGKVTSRLSRDLNTTVDVRHINFIPFNEVALQGVLIQDLHRDTLLYAGAIKVNLTDWFFFKSAIDLKFIDLQDATVRLNRTDSTWNYQFLVDYFSSPKPSTSKKGTAIAMKEVVLENISLAQVDKWIGQDMILGIGSLHLLANEINFDTKKVDVDELSTAHLSFQLSNYPGFRPDSLAPKEPADSPVVAQAAPPGKRAGHQKKKPAAPEPLQWNADGWNVALSHLRLDDCRFRNDGFTHRPLFTWFDPQHIDFNHINGRFNHVRFVADTLSADITTLSTKERSGFEVRKLTAKARFTPKIMEFRQMDIQTNHSRLRDYFAMRYDDFNRAMGDYVNKVNMKAELKNATVSTDDIAYFAPELKDWKMLVDVNGKSEGPVAALKGQNLVLKVGQTTFISGDFAMTGLPDIDKTVMNFTLNDLRTTFAEVAVIVPYLKTFDQPNFTSLRAISYKGTFAGRIDDFRVNGNLSTNLGNVVTNLNLRLPAKGTPSYRGRLAVTNFDLGTFLAMDALGNFSFDGTVDGKGFAFDDLDATLKGDIAEATIEHYSYQNLSVEGTFKKKMFEGQLSIDDPNLAFILNGNVRVDKASPVFNFDADISRLNFLPLGLVQKNLAFQGKLSLDFQGKNIDDFTGTAKVFDATLTNDGEPISFDSLFLSSDSVAGKKVLTLQSLPVNARVEGEYHIMELPRVVQWYLGKYYPAYIKPIAEPPKKEDFTFKVRTADVEDYLDLLKLPIQGFDNSEISGRISTPDRIFNVALNVPEFSYKQYDFNDIDLRAQGNDNKIHLEGLLGEVVISDSLRLPNSHISLEAQNDTSVIALQTSANQSLNSAVLLARVHNTADGISARFDSSYFVLNDKKWLISSDGEIAMKKNWISIQNLKLTSALEQITFSTHPSATDPLSNDIEANLYKVTIEDLLPLVLKDPHLEGQMSGTITLHDPFTRPTLETWTQIDRFKFETDSIGSVNASMSYGADGNLHFNAGSENPHYIFTVEGGLDLQDSANRQIHATIRFDHTSIHPLEKYLGFIFSDMDGQATGTIQLSGPLNDPQLQGKVTVNNGTLTVNYTRCKYKLDNEDIDLKPGLIDFNSITLKDTLGNPATLSGRLTHDFFKNMTFNLRLTSNKLLVLNTTARDNKNFYGRAIARVNASLTGPESNILLRINHAEPVDSCHIFLPSGSSKAGSLPDFIVFREYGREMTGDESTFRISSNFTVDMNLVINPLARIDVILDATNGDVVRAQGNGNLLIRAGTSVPLTINGAYNIESGQYTYSYTNLGLRKPFTLTRGNIRWTGDPIEANINITASYLAEDVALPSTMISSTGQSISQSTNIIILCHLTNTLTHPAVSFEFQLPPDNPYKNDPIVTAEFKKFEQDPSEMNKQVVSLLFFDTFVASSDVISSNVSGGTLVAGTVGQVVAGQLAATLRTAVKMVLKDKSIDPYITINPGFAFQNNQELYAVSNVTKFGANKALLSGRLTVKAGASLDYSTNPSFAQKGTNLLWSPDLAVQWSISPDGHLRLTGYNRTNYDITYGRYNRTGVSLGYRKDFDRLIDLFAGERKQLNTKRPKGDQPLQGSN